MYITKNGLPGWTSIVVATQSTVTCKKIFTSCYRLSWRSSKNSGYGQNAFSKTIINIDTMTTVTLFCACNTGC